MIFNMFRRPRQDGSIARLYGAIVAQARAEPFYRDYGVPDSVNGRFEMVVLHAVLLLHRLEGGSGQMRELGQGVFDLFCQDMDANLREMGVGDLAVPREMRRMGEAFYGRRQAYQAALGEAAPRALASVLARNVFAAPSQEPPGAERLAAYMRESLRVLATQDDAALRDGALRFPDPAKSAAAPRQPEDAK